MYGTILHAVTNVRNFYREEAEQFSTTNYCVYESDENNPYGVPVSICQLDPIELKEGKLILNNTNPLDRRDYGCSMCHCEGGCDITCNQSADRKPGDKYACREVCDICYGQEDSKSKVNILRIKFYLFLEYSGKRYC